MENWCYAQPQREGKYGVAGVLARRLQCQLGRVQYSIICLLSYLTANLHYSVSIEY